MQRSCEPAAVARAQARHSAALRAHPHVIGTATGPQLTGGRPTGDLAVKVYVERKLPGLAAPDAVPRFVGGVPTDVIETGPARALSPARTRTAARRPADGPHPDDPSRLDDRPHFDDRPHSDDRSRLDDRRHPDGRPHFDDRSRLDDRPPVNGTELADGAGGRLRPVRGGGSIGCPGARGGTIATVCFDLRTGRPHLLSNHHVLVMAPGTRLRNRVVQPGGGDPAVDAVGRLARAAPLRVDGPNRVDAAIARLAAGVEVDAAPVVAPVPAELGQRVRKTGVTTGTTTGRIQDLNADIVVELRGRPIRFTGQLVLDLAAAPGDSGSLVVTGSGAPVGLLFAGTDAFVLANPLPAVLTALRIALPGR
jgi:hypothetical protein